MEELKFENDRLYVQTPMFEYGEHIYHSRLVMTKEVFVECYKKWILGENERGLENEGNLGN